jgi:hypothetical protein
MNAIVQNEGLFGSATDPAQQLRAYTGTKGGQPFMWLLLSLVPSATLMVSWTQFSDTDPWSGVCVEAAIVLAASLWFAELTLVPLLAKGAALFAGRSETVSAHQQFEFLEAFAPTVLMLAPLFLVVPRLALFGVAASFVAVAMLLFLVRYDHVVAEQDQAPATSWLVAAQGFISWAIIALLLAII